MKDYYLSYENFYKRLEDEFKKYGKLIIAYDFDDTVFNFHKDSNRHYDKVISLLKEWSEHAYTILFTSRETSRLQEAIDFVKENNIPMDSVNKNMPNTPFGNNNKVYYNVLLDDRAGLKWSYKALRKLIKKIKKGKING